MLKSLCSIFGSHQLLAGGLSDSSDISTGGIDVQVGRSVNAQTVHIPQIVNADPIIFVVIIEFLKCSSILERFRFNAPGQLQELVSKDDALLNLAKAWHVGDLLEMHGLQNKLLGIYRAYYLRCLKDHIRLPLDPVPFVYLRDNIGNHTKVERFIVDFHAGLMQTESSIKPKDFCLLPRDIAVHIRDRWREVSGYFRKDSFLTKLTNDRIAVGISHYKVSKSDATLRIAMQVQHLCAGPGPAHFCLHPSMHPQSRSSSKPPISSTLCSGDDCGISSTRMRERQSSSYGTTSTKASNRSRPSDRVYRVSKPVLTNPFANSTSRRGAHTSRPVSPTGAASAQHIPVSDYRVSTCTIQGLQAPAHQDPQQGRASPVSKLPSRAPFMPSSSARGPRAHEMDDTELTDEDRVYDLFAPKLPWLDAHRGRHLQSDREQVGLFWGFLISQPD